MIHQPLLQHLRDHFPNAHSTRVALGNTPPHAVPNGGFSPLVATAASVHRSKGNQSSRIFTTVTIPPLVGIDHIGPIEKVLADGRGRGGGS